MRLPDRQRFWQMPDKVITINHSTKFRQHNKSCQKTTTLTRRQQLLNSSQCYSFSIEGQTSRSRSGGQKLHYHVEGLHTRNTHLQYESSITSGKKVMAKFRVFQKVKLKGQGHEVRNYGTIWKVLSQGIHMCNESPITSGKKVMAMD